VTKGLNSHAPPSPQWRSPSVHAAAADLWGGLAAMLVALPSSIAFGVVMLTAASPQLASAGAMAGIIGAAVLGLVAPLVGRVRRCEGR